MSPLIVFLVGIVAMILFMTASVWVAVMMVAALVLTCLFRIRHLMRSPHRGGRARSGSAWPFFWNDPNNPGGENRPTDELGRHHHGHHHHHHGSAPDASSGGHSHHHHDSSSFGGGDGGGHHGGGGDFGGGGGHH